MLNVALLIAFVVVGLAMLLCLYRLVRGPTLPDRVLALDTLYINAIILVLLYGMAAATHLYFEVALLIALIGFVGTVALAKHMTRGDLVE